MADRNDNVRTQPAEAGRSAFRLIWSTIKLFFGFFAALVLSLVFSIAIEIIGVTFVWDDVGSKRSAEILKKEVQYIQSDRLKSSLMQDQSSVVLVRASEGYKKLDEYTTFDKQLQGLGEYGRSIRNVTSVFFIRMAVVISLMVLYGFVTVWCFNEGLLLRAKRRWSGAVERSFVFHHLKASLFWITVLPIPIYLMLPFAVHPLLVTAPFMLIYGLLLVFSVGFFKKVL